MRVLIEGCKNHDRESQRLLYKHYYSFAMAICVRYSGSVDEAKEILNDGFMKVYSKIDLYDTNRSFEGWLKRLMINTAIDYFRSQKKYQNQTTLEGHDQASKISIVDELSYNEILMLVQQLSPMYRAVFSLFVIDGYPHEEIAKKLNISVGTSKSNLSKARANLRKMLKFTTQEVYEQYI
ncbi:sigma-70 family RNA polymerase sigma factor [Fulvivirga sp. RKSG066]|uniref:RNA polymerase sigma factor n=1 Tax=Fulvivirga aurantia TaxID=2529383 RepID=UPI0012BBB4F7|nr:sigma-70 family RNA polymerase sigma factor [Fulvivirga aurantia]MTI23052.1 sigma-70 family RNA polymerase sigma factor [Fulvivirga aurantia]